MIMNAFTVDLEDWFQGLTSTNNHPADWEQYEKRVERNVLQLLAIFREYGVKATFFVLGRVAHQHPDLIRQIEAEGHEIGIHGYWHLHVRRITPERFADELDKALEAVTPLVKEPIIGHRAPYFSIDGHSLWALDILKEKGFEYDSSFFPTWNMLYGYPKAPRFPHQHEQAGLYEFPVSTARWLGRNWPVAGGFYLRFFPYELTRRGIRQINRDGQPAILYLHPWEIDVNQGYRKVTLRERLTHYYGREKLTTKLHRLFTDFQFVPLRQLYLLGQAVASEPPSLSGGMQLSPVDSLPFNTRDML
jgi:polysaccharide deacetylase family protein (PEP-CTERM system associated)